MEMINKKSPGDKHPSPGDFVPTHRPQIAVVSANTLTGLGLSGIIRTMMPGAEVRLFSSHAELAEAESSNAFFHYFISVHVLMDNARYYLDRLHKTIVLVHGDEVGHLPPGFHTLNVCQSEKHLVRDILQLARSGHHAGKNVPEPVRRVQPDISAAPKLTLREQEVLRLIVSGFINKEIADRLGISLTTVISHRKNITEKLDIKSVSGLTIYAVTHGIIRAEEI